jgi:hypothetical protein
MKMAKTRKDAAQSVEFKGGPFAGKTARLSGDTIRQTAEFTASGMTGSYQSGKWCPANNTEEVV